MKYVQTAVVNSTGARMYQMILAMMDGTVKLANMTKKDYILIAETIKKAHEALLVGGPETNRYFDYIINHFTMSLKHDNPRFDENKFAEACKIN